MRKNTFYLLEFPTVFPIVLQTTPAKKEAIYQELNTLLSNNFDLYCYALTIANTHTHPDDFHTCFLSVSSLPVSTTRVLKDKLSLHISGPGRIKSLTRNFHPFST